jgi:hypothetical protein
MKKEWLWGPGHIDPEINETLKHMAEHDEIHLHQIQSIVSGLHNTEKKN